MKEHRHTADTPTSQRQARVKREAEKAEDDARRVKHVQERRQAVRERPLTAKELEQARELSLQGLIRTPEQQTAYRAGLNLLATSAPSTRNRYAPDRFGPVKAEAIAGRWSSRV
jgi:hypothetical protein